MEFRKLILLGALCLAGSPALFAQPAGQPVSNNSSLLPLAPTPKPAAALPASLTPQPGGVRTLDKQDLDAWLDGYMPYALNTGGIPGAVVVVVKDGKILTARGFGYANAEKRLPVDPDRTLFRPGSVSKLVTWTAVMQLVEQGKLDLDTDVNRYLDFKIPPLDGQPITLRQMMTHTAGFEEAAKDIINYAPAKAPQLDVLMKAWVPERIFRAGTTPAYSNYATSLAGYVVQRISGEPFDDYVERHVFQPLGMAHASFRQPLQPALAPLMSVGYGKPGEPPRAFEVVGPAPAGALSASGTDMGRFMIAHLQQGELDQQRILSAATAATMHNSPLDKVNPLSLVGPLNRMELGFFETNINGREVIAHLGDLEAFHTSLHLFMKDGVGFYASFNSTGKDGAAGTLRTALFHDFADRYFADASPADGKVDDKTAAEHARLMTGTWQSSRRSESNFFSVVGMLSQMKVGLDEHGGLLVPGLVGRDGQPRKWVEIAPFVWRDSDGHDRLAATVKDGQVVRWSMDFMSPFMVFDRVPAGKSSAWLNPTLGAAVAVLLLTLLAWPASWLSRRTHGAAKPAATPARRAVVATRIASGLILALLLGWVGLFSAMFSSLKYASAVSDPYLWILQVLGVLILVGGMLAGARNLQLTMIDGRGWMRKLWSLLVFASTVLIFYTALRFGLIAMTVNY
ncbi:serine hydrolase [Pseudoduganella sp. FT26W]|uniref:Serine hydrolase n=1 Tax=Duganella aquatilis TaxID=2666082 RepID=A0A844D4I9_9BURK|nr:serine hydrolase domain-containing protein [Duganella aquatilis]MRW83046.1 serine hydrolase [Duganella aquatilis]